MSGVYGVVGLHQGVGVVGRGALAAPPTEPAGLPLALDALLAALLPW